MTSKPVALRELARRDIDGAIDFYLAEAGEAVALRFVGALQAAISAIGRHRAAGSPRYGHQLELPGLRGRLLRRFPYVVFHMERDRDVDVWRVLHANQDMPAWLEEP
jgi:toxin ParE1/3/4